MKYASHVENLARIDQTIATALAAMNGSYRIMRLMGSNATQQHPLTEGVKYAGAKLKWVT
ncbi:MAG: hypothetical protein OXM01_11210 [Gemmatimonadota bacterium]|nr:hypothetical protein [Gemmatimonadota bacterium]